MTSRFGFRFLAIACLFFALLGVRADPAAADVVETNLTERGLAVNGYDPVAYFTDGRPVLGEGRFTYEYDGAIYRFATETNRQSFIANPTRYMPAYGGFCAYGVRTGRKFEIDPDSWRIVDDRLYLLLNPATKVIWDLQRSNNIQIADTIWPKIKPFTDAELERRSP